LRACLRHKTGLSKFRAERKGFSSIVGAIFMVIIVWILASGYFIYTLSQNTVYNDAIREKNLLESNALSENVQATNTTYVVNANDKVNVSTSITNIGSLSVQFITLWAYASNDTPYTGYNSAQLSNVNVQGGANLRLSVNVTVGGLRPTNAYNFASWLITGRGNVVPVEIAPPPEPEPEHLPISATGFFSLDWFYLKYTAKIHLTPSDAAVISKQNEYVAFYINVTNNGDEAMTIKSTSLIMLLIEWQEPLFYIVRNVSYSGTPTITKYDDATPIIIGSHQSQILTFAAKSTAQPTTWAWGDHNHVPVGIDSGSTPEGAIVMTALVYTMQSQPTKTYAQSLSFRALVLGP
jgi:archaellum component FlaF (FlaF/FlaG flagellin family)